jgi:hypothetical protein
MVAWNLPLPWLESEVRKSMTTEMRLDRFVARLRFAPRLEGDIIHGLPPGRPAEVIHLDCLPGAPKDWIRSRGSYVVPVDVGLGIWFDWRTGGENDVNTAIVPSVKGMNPFTGQKLEALRLESYVEKCPVHAHPFKGPDRLCEKCGWNWPPQNYITSDSGPLWADGFRQSDGTVRQFFFSDEDKRDIASLVIGKENTVPAFGFGFWSPKNPRLIERHISRDIYYGGCVGQSLGFDDSVVGAPGLNGCEGVPGFMGVTGTTGPTEGYGTNNVSSTSNGADNILCYNVGETKGSKISVFYSQESVPAKSIQSKKSSRSVSIGAGAKLKQELTKDSLGLDGWKPEPEAIIRLYFVFEEQFRELVGKGIRDLKGEQEGYLKGLPVG